MKTKATTQQILVALGAALLLLTACQAPQAGVGDSVSASGKQDVNHQCLTLLYDLLDQQQNLDKLLLIKAESDVIEQLVKSIASTSAAGAKRLEELAAQDPSLDLKQTVLPVGELAVRDAIAGTKKKILLTPFNPDFELQLLLTQTDALSYGWHLAKVAADHEVSPGRKRFLTELTGELESLHKQTLKLLRGSTEVAQKNKKGNL